MRRRILNAEKFKSKGGINKKHKDKSAFIRRNKQTEQLYKKQQSIQLKSKEIERDSERSILNLIDEVAAKPVDKQWDNLICKFISNSSYPETEFTTTNTIVDLKNEKSYIAESTEVTEKDYFLTHYNYNLSNEQIEILLTRKYRYDLINWSDCGSMKYYLPINGEINFFDVNKDFKQPNLILSPPHLLQRRVKSPLHLNILYPMSGLQTEIFYILNSYLDFYFTNETNENSKDIQYIYSFHVLNHTLKSRARIKIHEEKLLGISRTSKTPFCELIIPDNYQDQNLHRLKVLMILPMRNIALNAINVILKQFYGSEFDKSKKNGKIANYNRFLEEYSVDNVHYSKPNKKPLDFENMFSGNIDDNFKIGIRFNKKSVTLFSNLNTSDILVASPLALRKIIGDTSSRERDCDFLNSIEVLIVDKAELIFAQNCESLLHILEHINLQPKNYPRINCQRIRTWCLNGFGRFYRQTIIFSSHELPELRAVFSNKCKNYTGFIRTSNPVHHGTIGNVIVPIQQIFRGVNCSSAENSFDERFSYFINEVLPQYTNSLFAHCMVYVSSYFDFVRLRNYFKAATINFVQISEYTSTQKISRARDMFFHSGAHFLLYSERAHFFKRNLIKGIRHLIFYQPPNFPHFYPEIINYMLEINQNSRDGLANSMTITTIYTKYDLLALNNIIGSKAALNITKSNQLLHTLSSV